MSKFIKQLEMDNLKQTFHDVREFVLLSVTKLDCTADNQLRANLRKKNIRVQMVKNSLAQRALDELGVHIPKDSPYWAGNTWVAWGPESVAELSQAIDATILKDAKYKGKITAKGAVTEGQPVPFETARTMPTRTQAIGQILAAILGPASEIASQIVGPASQVAGQVQTIADKKPEEAAAPAT
jgi:large subunit ribosomal protein L10